MATTLGNMAVGSTIKLKVDNYAYDFFIIHQGRPSTLYDSSCNGTWALMKNIYKIDWWHEWGGVNDYANSLVHDYLNNDFLKRFDTNIKNSIKQVKIPYCPGSGTSKTVNSGANGLSAKIFLLSSYEVGWTTSKSPYLPVDGACLSYFSETAEADYRRIAKPIYGSETEWWLRSPYTNNTNDVWFVTTNGNGTNNYYSPVTTLGVRPAFILDSSLFVSSDGSVTTNVPPTIMANKSGNLGTLTDGFDVTYSVSDENGDAVTVTETLDSKQIRSYKATPNKQETYSLKNNDWISLANGSHTFKISATDGTDTVEHTITFTRNNRAPVITMSRSGSVGTLTDGVDLTYSVTDADNDAVTVTETFDDKQGRQYAAVLGQDERFSVTGSEWLQVTNGSHTVKISASDGQQTAEKTLTFTRDQTSLSVTLEEPFEADDNIVACQLNVEGDIPDDAVCTYEVTNNALDDEPVWEDCTEQTKAGRPYMFANKAVSGFAFNFRVSIKRGSSNTGGYITKIWGGFE